MGRDKALLAWPPTPDTVAAAKDSFLSSAIKSLTLSTDFVLVVAGQNETALAPVVYANHETSHRVADMVMGACASFWPDRVMACSQGTSAILTLGGVDPSGRAYVSYETVKGGFGARPTKDGINVVASGISNTMNTPVEVLEMAFPVRVERYEINADSGGAGRFRGGCGARRVWRLIAAAAATGSLCMP